MTAAAIYSGATGGSVRPDPRFADTDRVRKDSRSSFSMAEQPPDQGSSSDGARVDWFAAPAQASAHDDAIQPPPSELDDFDEAGEAGDAPAAAAPGLARRLLGAIGGPGIPIIRVDGDDAAAAGGGAACDEESPLLRRPLLPADDDTASAVSTIAAGAGTAAGAVPPSGPRPKIRKPEMLNFAPPGMCRLLMRMRVTPGSGAGSST